MYGGMVEGVGPRYCPSIEDKLVRFADKESHQLFIEPESVHLNTVYLQGFSTSMPKEVQEQMVHSLPGFEHSKILKYAYAIEYDAFDPTALKPSLESKHFDGLFLAGQINGTSGYEEAAAQGLIAAINAARKIEQKAPLILKRSEAYIGVMIDDLTTKGTKEPYRLLTSRAEFRLLLRHDNADMRLRKYGYESGLVSDDLYRAFLQKQSAIETLTQVLQQTIFSSKHPINQDLLARGFAPIQNSLSAAQLLKRPNHDFSLIKPYLSDVEKWSNEVIQQVEIAIKYEGYIKKQLQQVEAMNELEDIALPVDMDYQKVPNLAIEARQKLNKIRPLNIGQASRISGVNPSDIGILAMYLKLTKEG
jgi:tRNA uridine 5-carboxymethylaminomethyl modification enzyme